MNELMKQKVKITDARLFTNTRRLQPKSPPPLSESYSRPREGQGVADLAVPVAFPPSLLPLDVTTDVHATCPAWEDPNRWGSAMPLTSWDDRDEAKITTFSAQNRDYFAVFAPNTELSFPTAAHQDDVVGHSGNNDGSDGSPSDRPFEKWQVSSHGAPVPVQSISALSYRSMSYTAADTHTCSHVQPIDLIVPFSSGSDVTDLHSGFTNASFGVAGTPFDNTLVGPTGATIFPQVRSTIADDFALQPAFRFPLPNHHPGRVPHVICFDGEEGPRAFGDNAPWYGETPDTALDRSTIPRPPPVDQPFLSGVLGSDGRSEPPISVFKVPIPSRDKTVSGGVRPERARRSRGQLRPKDREETSRTRKWKACIRCRMQKIRCIPDPDKPETECCLCCRKILVLETKKVIHRIPCLRWNLNEVVLFRIGGLGFTKRWAGVCVENIPSSDWADERVLTIGVCITKLHCDPLPLKVRKFKPNSTDIQYRYWKSRETEPPTLITIPAYALADVDATSEEYRRYVKENAEEAVRRFVRDPTVNDYVQRTFSIALHHGAKAAHREFEKARGNPAKLFRNYFRLWLASRFTLGSAYVANGHENLEEMAQSSANLGRQFVSRMVTAQFDSIGYKHVLVKLKREVLDELWLLMQKRTDNTFFTVYLIVFMMLHEVSVACQDRRRRAKEQGLKTYYDLEEATAKIKHGADIILGHWHYYKGDIDPLTMTEDNMARAFGAESSEEIRLLTETYQECERIRKTPRSETDGEEHPLYLAAQMFEPNWRPAQSCWP